MTQPEATFDTMDTLLDPEIQIRPRKVRHYVLVVDDDRDQTEVLSQCLHRNGFVASAAVSVEQARDRMAEKAPDLILLDIELPGMSGLDWCQELVDDSATCLIPIIIMSGRGNSDIVRRSRLAGCRYFVRKPYDLSALLLLAKTALDDQF